MTQSAGRLVASLLLGVPAGAALYLVRLALAHPEAGAALMAHPLLVLPALLGAGAVGGVLALAGLADPPALHWCMIAAAALIFVLSERGKRA